MRTKVVWVVTAALLLGADAPKERPVDKDRDALQGKWRSTSSTRDGEKLDGAKKWTVLVVDKDAISWEESTLKGDFGETGVVPFSYKLDPSKDPKTIDLTLTKYANKGKKQLGIYRLQGDELTICVSWKDKARPKKFESERSSGYQLLTLKRVEK
jgi:uncharacterized protein (TIGR03067 family)